MGVYINQKENPGVFKYKGKIDEPNQRYYKTDYFSDLIHQQEMLNKSLTKGIKELASTYHQHESRDNSRWEEISGKVNELKDFVSKQEQFEQDAREWFQVLENNNQELQRLMKSDREDKEEMNDEITRLSQSNQEITQQLVHNEYLSDQLSVQMKELADLQQKMLEIISEQEEKQDRLLGSYENQEALLEKTYRHIEHIRTIIFERTNHIVEKIESNYRLTSSLLYKLFTGSEKPLTLYMTNKENHQSKSD